MGKGKKYILSEQVEFEIDEMAEWYRKSGVKHASIRSYSTRLREFAAWFSEQRGRGVTVQDVNEQLLGDYKEYLHSNYPTWTEIQARLTSVRRYNHWAVETGKLPETARITIKFKSKARSLPRKQKEREKLVEGEESFIEWMLEIGRKPSTTDQQVYTLRSIGRWAIARGEGILTPENATPEFLDLYWEEKKRSKGRYPLGRAAMHNYAHWAVDQGLMDTDPFIQVTKWTKRASHGGWLLIDKLEAQEFLDWVKKESGLSEEKAYKRVARVAQFFRWHYLLKGKMITHSDTTPELFVAYERYLRQTRKPPSERSTLSGATINGYLYAARWFVRWAEFKETNNRD